MSKISITPITKNNLLLSHIMNCQSATATTVRRNMIRAELTIVGKTRAKYLSVSMVNLFCLSQNKVLPYLLNKGFCKHAIISA